MYNWRTIQMKFSQLKAIKTFCESLHSTPDWREVIDNLDKDNYDFEVDNVRFIKDSEILDVLADELANDEYLLGCFNASAIAEATGWPQVLIEAAQKGEAFEEIGKAMTGEDVMQLAHIYSQADGFGHHFNSYDFSEEEIIINGELFHVFDNR